MRRSNWIGISLVVLSLCLLVGCQPAEQTSEQPAPSAPEPEPESSMEAPHQAVAEIYGQAGSDVHGTATFTETADGVEISAEVSGVSPAGLHGFHIHEVGDCSADDFTSAGGHFNPGNTEHGAPGAEMSHAGDLGNIEIGEDGTGSYEWTSTKISLGDGPDSIIGRSVVLHEGEDDLTSQPSGAAGARIGCGVIEHADMAMPDDESDEMGEEDAGPEPIS